MWTRATGFWTDTGRAARPAIIATTLLVAVTVISFVGLVMAITRSGYSLGVAIFGPLPGPGSGIFFLSFAVPAIVLQGMVALALRQRIAALRFIGIAGALTVVIACVGFAVAVSLEIAQWMTTGLVRDVGDLVGEIVAVPLAGMLAALNVLAAWFSVIEFREHEPDEGLQL